MQHLQNQIIIVEELSKPNPSAKKISKLLKKKAYNSKTLKNEELDELQNREKKIAMIIKTK